MLAEKEINIVKALVEEEISKSDPADDSGNTNLISSYRHTLSGIVHKLHELQNSCPGNFVEGSLLHQNHYI